MYGRSGHCCTFKLNRIEYGNGIYKPRSARAPLDLPERCLCSFIGPLERNRIPGRLCGPSEGNTVINIIVCEHKTVRRNVISGDLFFVLTYRIHNRCGCDLYPLYRLEAERFEERKPSVCGCQDSSILTGRVHQIECNKSHMSACGDLRIKLSYGSAAEIPRVLVFVRIVYDRCVDLLEILIRDNCFTSYYKFSDKGDLQRHIVEHPCIWGDDFSYLSVSSGDCLG